MSEFYRLRDCQPGNVVIPKWAMQSATSGLADVPLRLLTTHTYGCQLELVGGCYDGMSIRLGNGALVRKVPPDLNSQLSLFEEVWPILSGQPERVE